MSESGGRRSGRAVSREAGAAYQAKLLPLPRFLWARANAPPAVDELRQAFALTGYFFGRHVYEPRGIAPPPSRERFLALLGPSISPLEGENGAPDREAIVGATRGG